MKIYKNQTLDSARQLGYASNYRFSSDRVAAPNGVDITPVRRENDDNPYEYEVTENDDETRTATIRVMNPREYEGYLKELEESSGQ